MTPTLHAALLALLADRRLCLTPHQRAALTRAGYSTGGQDPTLTEAGEAALADLERRPSEPDAWMDIGGKRWASNGACIIREDSPRPLERGRGWGRIRAATVRSVLDRTLHRGATASRYVVWSGAAGEVCIGHDHMPILEAAARVEYAGPGQVRCYDEAGDLVAVVAGVRG